MGISWAAILVRWSDVSAYVLAFWRLTLSLAVIAGALTASREWPRLFEVRRSDAALLVLAGLLLAFHFVTWFISLDYTTVASSTLFVSLHPIFAAGLSAVWLHERPSRREWSGIAVALTGAAVIGGAGLALGPEAMKGNMLALSAGVADAGYFVIGRALRRRLGIWPYVGWVYLVAALALLPFICARGEALFDYPAREWWIFIGLAAGPMLLGHTGLNWVLRYVRAYIVNLAVLSEPIGASLLAWWLLGGDEVPGLSTIVGGVLILTGLAVSIYSRRGANL
ncbi:MAG: DMT family transporter [Gemmatimonadota bacterium]|nr:MAG: DMT family transporter [Gemmatimonadota bacterium]